MKRSSVFPHLIHRYEKNDWQNRDDLLAVEEPLEIRLVFGSKDQRQERRLTITMRTPGHDFELAMGFLWSESIIGSTEEVLSIRYCETVDFEEERGNVLRVQLSPALKVDWAGLERNFYASASCGICGKAAIEGAWGGMVEAFTPEQPQVSADLICQLPVRLQEKQALFSHTGGLHAAALFDSEGELLLLREDIGRHNALDKLIGAAKMSNEMQLPASVLMLSGRVGFELVQKALQARIPVVAAVGAPSSLALQTAEQSGMTLIGFLREGRFNVYSGVGRITPSDVD
jgi:FdhD protein